MRHGGAGGNYATHIAGGMIEAVGLQSMVAFWPIKPYW